MRGVNVEDKNFENKNLNRINESDINVSDYETTNEVVAEHRFWLQIMGDHARFIFFSLAPNEVEYLQRAQDFIISFDQLLDQSRKQLTSQELSLINRQAYLLTCQFREFKLLLLALTLNSDIMTQLTSSFINDMLNELEEYNTIINLIMNGQPILFHPIHYHLIWLKDAIGHSASVAASLDLVEKDMIDKSHYFEALFTDLLLKATMMNGYLRTKLEVFPSLSRLNMQVENEILQFKDFLENLRVQRVDGMILGTLLPLMADHMSREECYYLWKLSQTAGLIQRPDCDPARPRLET